MLFTPLSAHEVYVLDQHSINIDRHNHSVDIWQALNSGHNLLLFLGFAILISALLALVLFLKSTRFFKALGKQVDKTTIVAPDIIRIAFGASLLFSASHNALYGPELPLASFTGAFAIKALLWASGTALVLGLWSRLWSAIMVAVWLAALLMKGPYLLTYANYLGEALAILLLPLQRMSVDNLIVKKSKATRMMRYGRFSMPTARLLFGFSLLYTAVSVKFMDTAISLDVVNKYHLTQFFPFDPLFVVLGAALIECMVAVLYMAGLLQRFTTIIFLVFMTLSLIFFKESVWPHYLLIALGVGIFLHKPDVWALDGYLFKSMPVRTRRKKKRYGSAPAKAET